MSSAAYTLLLIEDDNHVRGTLATCLRDIGYEVLTVSGTGEGLEACRREAPDLVLCDLNTPGLNGNSVAATLRFEMPLIPVVVMAAEEDMDAVPTALREGAADYLTKPVTDMKVLEHAIGRSLEQSKLRRENLDYQRRLEQSNRELQESIEELKQDQKAGRQVQFSMLPPTPKQIGEYEFIQKIVPSLYLSGDFVDYFRVGDNHVVFFIADVSGHGASSAFVTVLLKNYFAGKRRDHFQATDNDILSPVKMLKRANRSLLRAGIGKHATLCVGVLDLVNNTLCYSVAGHLPLPLLASGGEIRFLPGEGMPIGLFEDAEFSEQTIELPEDAVLTLFSDGIFEVLGADGLLQKEELLLEKLRGAPRKIEDIVSALDLGQVFEFPDDIAALLICRQPRQV